MPAGELASENQRGLVLRFAAMRAWAFARYEQARSLDIGVYPGKVAAIIWWSIHRRDKM